MTRIAQCRYLALVAPVILASATALAADDGSDPFQVGPLRIGGAIRVNYVAGDYNTGDDAGSRSNRRGDGGNFELDTVRLNLDFAKDQWIGKGEYRFYDGYHFVHTLWGGYRFDDGGELQLGINRVPFGVGPYGASNGFFFDLNYYVGLSDDMDLGLKYSRRAGNWLLDVGYYPQAEPNGVGMSEDSARYSYDIVDEGSGYSIYEERHQFNARAIYDAAEWTIPSELGVSAQYGLLDARSSLADDSDAYAAAVHYRAKLAPWDLKTQLTRYHYRADYTSASGMSNDLIGMGAYDFAWPVAAEGTIASAALSYTWDPGWEIIDTITFYNDFSVLFKDGRAPSGRDLNDSVMNALGCAIAKGNWFIYVDYVLASGNLFVGNSGDDYSSVETVSDFGVNGNDDYQWRFNVNVGYYF